jgi:2-polyprenyl-3-methyl-5-hydroxy-6-metoxy-1,4-benzoquinol methylase
MTFDAAYYRKFYFGTQTAVTSKREMAVRARLITAYIHYIGIPVCRILDAGCGTGWLRRPLLSALPKAHYVGIEASEYLCKRYGWQHARLQSYRSAQTFELLICFDVLQYLDDRAATLALRNFSRLCSAVLYFSALTRLDWRHNCDQRRTDSEVFLRSADWYRRRLRSHFVEVGAGLWLLRTAPVTIWELEGVDTQRLKRAP